MAQPEGCSSVFFQTAWNEELAPGRVATVCGTSRRTPPSLSLTLAHGGQEKGLREHPASTLPDPWCFKGGVTLACSRANEAVSTLSTSIQIRGQLIPNYRHVILQMITMCTLLITYNNYMERAGLCISYIAKPMNSSKLSIACFLVFPVVIFEWQRCGAQRSPNIS